MSLGFKYIFLDQSRFHFAQRCRVTLLVWLEQRWQYFKRCPCTDTATVFHFHIVRSLFYQSITLESILQTSFEVIDCTHHHNLSCNTVGGQQKAMFTFKTSSISTARELPNVRAVGKCRSNSRVLFRQTFLSAELIEMLSKGDKSVWCFSSGV